MDSVALTLPPKEDQIAPFAWPKDETPVATHFRGSWLAASLRALRKRGLLDRYLDVLPKGQRDEVQGGTSRAWFPIEVAMTHYAACDALGLSEDEEVAIGQEVALDAHRKTHALALRMAGQGAVTPWTAFALQRRLWLQVWRGGDIATFKDGPRDARVEIVGWPCARIPYIRHAMRGVLLGQTSPLCTGARVEAIDALCTPMTLGYRVTWQ